MRSIFLTFFYLVLFLNTQMPRAETLVDGVVAVITFHKDDTTREPVHEVILFSDLERHRLFFENDQPGSITDPDLWNQRLDEIIGQTLLKPEATRFVPKPPSEKEIENHLRHIQSRFKNDTAFKQALEKAALTLPDLKMEIQQFLWTQKLIRERISEFIFISPKEVSNYYIEHLKNYRGKPFEEIEKEIEDLLVKKKETTKKAAYIKRLKEKVDIDIVLKNEFFRSEKNSG